MQMQMQQLAVAGGSHSLQSGSLYVGDLDPETTETDLILKFSLFGPLCSVRLCRCIVTGESLRYAYVNFQYPLHASEALACLNHTRLKGKPMRIMWCQRDPFPRKCGIGNLFVKNLDPSIDSAQLQHIFCQFGTILSCKVAEENGKSKGFGFVQFNSEESAIAACTGLHGTMLAGKELCLSKFVKKSERAAAFDDLKFKNLYVKNFDGDVTEDFIKKLFSAYGKVHSVSIMKDRNGKSRGFGFVKFKSPEAAKNAVQALNGELVGSKTLFVGRAQKKAERAEILKREFKDKYNCYADNLKASNLYVKNLNRYIDDRKFRELFCGFGQIISAKVMCRDDGISKGFGFVCFSSPEEAKKASDAVNGSKYGGKTLYVAIAQRKEDRRRELQNYYQQNQPKYSCPSNGNVVTRQFPPLYVSFPPYWPPPFSLPRQPILYQHYGTSVGLHYPFAAQNHQKSFSLYNPMTQPFLGNNRDWVYHMNSMPYSTSNAHTQDTSRVNPWVQKAGFRENGSKRSGQAESSSNAAAAKNVLLQQRLQ
ncbi:RRM_1 domain-containing protein [Cephalotus follicularis]|uniref:RRM_1 domain-containing protein n=1 Tax=Cephalotus follicularis TaxID=3775 RepID=A0A1Q3C754_CEPFO|nr:RRM_1 domain-containing protein [Cephalotus follicularis]